MHSAEAQKTLQELVSVGRDDELEKLEMALLFIRSLPHAEQDAFSESLFGILERFPTGDAFGLFWTILHILEQMPNFERKLEQSLQRQPSEFGLLMAKRLHRTHGSTP